jgi:hypothetical protein
MAKAKADAKPEIQAASPVLQGAAFDMIEPRMTESALPRGVPLALALTR